MKPFALSVVVACLLCPSVTQAADSPAAEEWLPLFNGKDLTGWTPKIKGYDAGENFGQTFRVEDGVLKVAYDQYGTAIARNRMFLRGITFTVTTCETQKHSSNRVETRKTARKVVS